MAEISFGKNWLKGTLKHDYAGSMVGRSNSITRVKGIVMKKALHPGNMFQRMRSLFKIVDIIYFSHFNVGINSLYYFF